MWGEVVVALPVEHSGKAVEQGKDRDVTVIP